MMITKITPHPVLKLTKILDEINDKEYIKDSDNYKLHNSC